MTESPSNSTSHSVTVPLSILPVSYEKFTISYIIGEDGTSKQILKSAFTWSSPIPVISNERVAKQTNGDLVVTWDTNIVTATAAKVIVRGYTPNPSDPSVTETVYNTTTHSVVVPADRFSSYEKILISYIIGEDGTSREIIKSNFSGSNIEVNSPIILPPEGAYTTAQSVTISTPTSGAEIYYTLDSSSPTTASTRYTGSFNVSASSTTIKAIAVKTGLVNSYTITSTFFIGPLPVISNEKAVLQPNGDIIVSWNTNVATIPVKVKINPAVPTPSDPYILETSSNTTSHSVTLPANIIPSSYEKINISYIFPHEEQYAVKNILKSAIAPADFDYVDNSANITITKYKGAGGAVVIPGTIIGKPVTIIGDGAFANCVSVTSVVIPNGVTNINYYAFSGCYGLTSVTMPNSVTSIGMGVFSGCNVLTNIAIPASVTSIGLAITSGCYSLTSIDVDAANPNYSSESGVLYNKNKTALITYPIGKSDVSFSIPGSVTSIENQAFWGFGSLRNINIPGSVTSIHGNAFWGCQRITAFNVDGANLNYSSQSGVLYNKNKTILIQYPTGNSGAFTIPESVTSIGDYAFHSGRDNITGITMPGNLNSIGKSAFYGCTSLTSLIIPSGVTNIGEGAFEGCSNMTSANFKGNAPTTVGQYVFEGCAPGFKIYYKSGTSGWSNPWNGYTTVSSNLSIDLGGGVTIEMVRIPAGTFQMGSPDTEQDRHSDEGPVHTVTVSKDFYIGKYEITQGQWTKINGINPSIFKNGDNYPVENVSWDDCQGFIGNLNLNYSSFGTFRLPTEAEWEYACRSGSSTRLYWGDDPSYSSIGNYAWYNGNSSSTTHLVGQKLPNAFGIFDMSGNVGELCNDWYGSYSSNTVVDPSGPTTGSYRVFRGGSWDDGSSYNITYFRAAGRSYNGSSGKNSNIGFRLALSIK